MKYRILASFRPDGPGTHTLLDCSQWEILGDAINERFDNFDEAQERADELQDDIESLGLDSTTEYCVVLADD